MVSLGTVVVVVSTIMNNGFSIPASQNPTSNIYLHKTIGLVNVLCTVVIKKPTKQMKYL